MRRRGLSARRVAAGLFRGTLESYAATVALRRGPTEKLAASAKMSLAQVILASGIPASSTLLRALMAGTVRAAPVVWRMSRIGDQSGRSAAPADCVRASSPSEPLGMGALAGATWQDDLLIACEASAWLGERRVGVIQTRDGRVINATHIPISIHAGSPPSRATWRVRRSTPDCRKWGFDRAPGEIGGISRGPARRYLGAQRTHRTGGFNSR